MGRLPGDMRPMDDAPGSRRLNQSTFEAGIADLSARDDDLAAIVRKWGDPPFWTHPPGFSGLVLAILAQQVSLESAQAAFSKLETALGRVEAESFLRLDPGRLRAIGFSRQKASYVRGIAGAISAGELDFAQFETLENEQVRDELMAFRGIGRWTADTYLLFSMRRQDVWPSGDLALAKAIQEAKGLRKPVSFGVVDHLAAGWRPWRAVAARLLWHSYLSERGR
jgi:DNA-3-methyladenine glycosylase II